MLFHGNPGNHLASLCLEGSQWAEVMVKPLHNRYNTLGWSESLVKNWWFLCELRFFRRNLLPAVRHVPIIFLVPPAVRLRKLWMIQMTWLRRKVIVAVGRFPSRILSICGLLAATRLTGWPIHPSSIEMTRRISTQNERLKENLKFWDTLQGTNVSHLRKRKIVFKSPLVGDMLVPWR